MFYEKWAKQLDANLSRILADYDAQRHRALRIVLRPVFGFGGKAVQEFVLVSGKASKSCDFRRTLLKAIISKIALYNPGTYDIGEISWNLTKADFSTAIGEAESSAESFPARNNNGTRSLQPGMAELEWHNKR